MYIPDEFRYLMHCFYSEIREDSADEKEVIATAVDACESKQRPAALEFLQRFLEGDPSDQELRGMWYASGPNFGYEDYQELRQFLYLLLDELKRRT